MLAIIPCLIAYWISKRYKLKKWPDLGLMNQIIFLVLFVFWVIFLPNTAYLLTDIRHLVDYCEVPGYLRVCKDQAYIAPIFLMYAMIGVPTFYYALRQMTKTLRRLFNKTTSRIFPIVMIPIISIGVMLGLVARFNTWDIFLEPLVILHTVFVHLGEKVMLLNILSYTVMLYLIYYFIRIVRRRDRHKI